MTTTVDTDYRLDDHLSARHGRIFMNGTQALVRLLLIQRQRDARQGKNTAGFVTGYRGSPLAAVDTTLWKARECLQESNIRFLPAVNEDLAATIVMGTQQAGARDDRNVDGVFAMWYGKGPGVDRAGDALHHGNAAGASRDGGVLMIVGDDHTASSSSIAHASEHTLMSWRIPVIHPASVDEYEWFGLWGWALSRYSGAWVAFKAITETVESGRSIDLCEIPDFTMPAGDSEVSLHYSAREFLSPAMEPRMQARLQAVQRFARQHPLDRLVEPAPGATLGIISTGKAFLDMQDALNRLRASLAPGTALPDIRHYKVGLSWPLQTDGLLAFARGLSRILVVEEKAAFIETQVKEMLYNLPERPQVLGKHDARGQELISSTGQLSPADLVRSLERWLNLPVDAGTDSTHTTEVRRPQSLPVRTPYFCSGCPHNTSTRLPEGSLALAGVGCHYMATWMNRNTGGLTQMGGEGTDWVGLSGYVGADHIFQNMGEGTYFHSGYLAIRQAIAAKVNITYKILFNDAVAMTGGQPVDGVISVPRICEQLRGEGVKRIVVTTEDPGRYKGVQLARGITVHHRRELLSLQQELRAIKGVTVLIHDQMCAAEKRRRSKKHTPAHTPRRVVINADVCEGCGDCSKQSNCLSVVPLDTPLGRKRAIDQSSCNTDFSCVDGFCPSFVSVVGARPRKQAHSNALDHSRIRQLLDAADMPPVPRHDSNVLIAGVGGTGVITIGAVLAMAAHLEGARASVLDMTGLAQKGGSVISHVRITATGSPTAPVRIDAGQADTALVCDMIAATRPEALSTFSTPRTSLVINTHTAPTAHFIQDPDAATGGDQALALLRSCVAQERAQTLDAHALAVQHLGDSVFSNMIMLGYAWQKGRVPVSEAALLRAIELNGVAVEKNQMALRLGRLACLNPAAAAGHEPARLQAPEPLERLLQRLHDELVAYHNAAYARQFSQRISQVHQAEKRIFPANAGRLTRSAALALHKLMAVKDEYEVARLLCSPHFHQQLREQFEGDIQLRYHLSPPLLAPRDKHTGLPRKITLGSWAQTAFQGLRRLKVLRFTPLDIFGFTAERRLERRLARDFQRTLGKVAAGLTRENYAQALELVSLPMQLRGFGHVKAAHIPSYQARMAELGALFGAPAPEPTGHRQAAL